MSKELSNNDNELSDSDDMPVGDKNQSDFVSEMPPFSPVPYDSGADLEDVNDQSDENGKQEQSNTFINSSLPIASEPSNQSIIFPQDTLNEIYQTIKAGDCQVKNELLDHIASVRNDITIDVVRCVSDMRRAVLQEVETNARDGVSSSDAKTGADIINQVNEIEANLLAVMCRLPQAENNGGDTIALHKDLQFLWQSIENKVNGEFNQIMGNKIRENVLSDDQLNVLTFLTKYGTTALKTGAAYGISSECALIEQLVALLKACGEIKSGKGALLLNVLKQGDCIITSALLNGVQVNVVPGSKEKTFSFDLRTAARNGLSALLVIGAAEGVNALARTDLGRCLNVAQKTKNMSSMAKGVAFTVATTLVQTHVADRIL